MVDSWSAFVVIFDSCEVSYSKTNLHCISKVCSALFKIKIICQDFFSQHPSHLYVPAFNQSISCFTRTDRSDPFPQTPCIWLNWSSHPDRFNYSSLSFLCLCFFYFIWSVTIYSLCSVYRIFSFRRPATLQNMWKKFFFKGSCKYFWMDDVHYLANQMCVQTKIKIPMWHYKLNLYIYINHIVLLSYSLCSIMCCLASCTMI